MRKKGDFQIPMLGMRFGKLFVVERIDNKWKCVCDCGSYQIVPHKTILSFINGVKLYMMCTKCKFKIYKYPRNTKAWYRVYGSITKVDKIIQSYERKAKDATPNVLVIKDELYKEVYKDLSFKNITKNVQIIRVNNVSRMGFMWYVKSM